MFANIFDYLFQNINGTIDVLFDGLPTFTLPYLDDYITKPVAEGLSWIKYFVPVDVLVGITLAWIAAVAFLTTYNIMFKWASFLRG